MMTAAILGVLVGAALLGCKPRFDHLESCRISPSRPGASFSLDGLNLGQGQAIGVRLLPIDDSGSPMDPVTTIAADAVDASVLGVARTPTGDGRCGEPGDEGAWRFVFYGVTPGTTELVIRVDGALAAVVPVHVRPP